MKFTFLKFPRFISLLCVFFIILIFHSSCKKNQDPPLLGEYSSFLGGYEIKSIDTISVFGYTKKIDSVFSSNNNLKFLGSHQDPVFGRTDASILTNFSLPNDIIQVVLGTNPYLVKAEIVLTLASVNIIGNNSTPLNFEVYLLQNALDVNGSYSTNNYSLSSGVKIGSYSGTLVPVGDKLGLRIPLDNNFAQALITYTEALVSSTQLQQTYKGFFITCKNTSLNPSSSPGFIAQFDLDHPYSGLMVYYKPDGNNPAKSTQTFTFTFKGTRAKRINQVNYQPFLSSDIQLQKQLNGDTTLGANYWFLKGMNGTRIRLYIPHLTNLRNFGPVLVSRAELSLNVDGNKNPGTSLAPDLLSLFSSDSLGREMFTADQLSSLDFSRYGGDYIPSENKYVFNIAREVQQILNGTRKNHGFWLVVANPARVFASQRDHSLNHVVLGGHASMLRPVFKITLGIPK